MTNLTNEQIDSVNGAYSLVPTYLSPFDPRLPQNDDDVFPQPTDPRL